MKNEITKVQSQKITILRSEHSLYHGCSQGCKSTNFINWRCIYLPIARCISSPLYFYFICCAPSSKTQKLRRPRRLRRTSGFGSLINRVNKSCFCLCFAMHSIPRGFLLNIDVLLLDFEECCIRIKQGN